MKFANLIQSKKMVVFEQQNHKCAMCKRVFAYAEMAGDHIKPWSKGGKTVIDNLQFLLLFLNDFLFIAGKCH